MARGLEFTIAYRLLTGNHVFVSFKCFQADAFYFHNILWLFEGAVLFPVVDNALGIRWSYALKTAKLINRCCVNIDSQLFLGHYSSNSRPQQKNNHHKTSQNPLRTFSHVTLLPVVPLAPFSRIAHRAESIALYFALLTVKALERLVQHF